jgi:hypothetical protein
MTTDTLPDTDESNDVDDSWWGVGRPRGLKLEPDEYENEMCELVREDAPRRFAIVQDWGRNYDGRIATWGIAMDGDLYVFDPDYDLFLKIRDLDAVLARYTVDPHLKARIDWVDPEPTKD